jgi:hypothetical protein
VLWSYLDFTLADISPIILERSKEALLVFPDMPLDQRSTAFERDVVATNFHRIRELCVSFNPGDTTLDLQYLLCQPRPLIEVLTLNSESDDPLRMPGLLGAAAGHLRELTLFGVSTDCLPAFTQLTYLNISCDPDLDPLLALANMPNLRVLSMEIDNLQCCPPTYEGYIPHPKAIIHLPALREFKLAAALLHTSFLINHLNFPQSTFLELFTLASKIREWAPSLLQFIAHHKGDPVQCLQVTCQDYTIRFKCSLIDWIAKMECTAENLGPALQYLAQTIKLEHLELEMECWDAMTLDWAMVLEKLDGIKVLSIGGFLDGQKLLGSITTPDTSMLPKLERLIVKVLAGDNDSYDGRFERTLDLLCVRKEAGTGVLELKIIMGAGDVEEVTQDELNKLGELMRATVERLEIPG